MGQTLQNEAIKSNGLCASSLPSYDAFASNPCVAFDIVVVSQKAHIYCFLFSSSRCCCCYCWCCVISFNADTIVCRPWTSQNINTFLESFITIEAQMHQMASEWMALIHSLSLSIWWNRNRMFNELGYQSNALNEIVERPTIRQTQEIH